MTRLSFFTAALMTLVTALPAAAHPHIFVDAQATITFDDAGQVVSVQNRWTFDEAYSSWAVQGLDTNLDGALSVEELQPLADDNMAGLSEYAYYTFAGEGPDNLSFAYGSNPVMSYEAQRQTLQFDVAVAPPYLIRDTLELAVNDPEYYVAITFANADAVQLVNAPANCRVTLEDAVPMSDELAERLYELGPDVTRLPPDLEQALRGVQGSILINCPGGSATGKPIPPVSLPEPATALDAATQLAEARPNNEGGLPLGGPPPEPGLVLPKTGVLGWVAQQQADFYQAMLRALDALRTDWTAFWVLGGLSFLYGVFHAAGPGHGKVVIGSYVLANEAQVRRGVWLSFLSAMLQSAVAIGFVLVAASVLGLTSLAMNDAAHWIGVASYALIMLLGAWLLARKLLRLEHRHAHAPSGAPYAPGRLPGDAHYGHDHGHGEHHHHHHHHHHDHDHDHHDHAHIVLPSQTSGGWREQLGVVLAVGLRPCSGALIVLAFALSQGLLAAGIVAVLLMGVGTALTTGTLAALAVGAKGLAGRLAGADNPATGAIVWWIELLAAIAVLAFGALLLFASL